MSNLSFDRTVLLVLEHTAEGAMGVVLNRPTPIAVAEAVPAWAGRAADPPMVFLGGPVGQGAVLVLARRTAEGPCPSFAPVVGDVGVLDLSQDPDTSSGIDRVRFFSGYSGWGPGQLDRELAGGAWFLLEPEPTDALTDTPDELWAATLKRQEGRVAMASQDPTRHWLN